MSPILLATVSAQYIHAARGLCYLPADLGELGTQTTKIDSLVIEYAKPLVVP